MSPATAHPPDTRTTRWRLDPSRSSIEFRVGHLWGMSTVKGTFTRYRGTLDLAADRAIDLTIDAASLDTSNRRRDKHLRSPDFFDVENHPQIRFVSETAALDGELLEVHGGLLARGEILPLTVSARLRQVDEELEIEARSLVDHRRLGMTWNVVGMVRAPSELALVGRLVPDDAA